MKRRNTLKYLILGTGGSLIIPATLFTSCQSNDYQPLFFSKKNLVLLNEIGETILPETEDSPGAKALKVAHFMDVYVADCYPPQQQQLVQTGLITFQKECEEKNGQAFLKMSDESKKNWLEEIDKQAKANEAPHYFSLLKNLVVLGYFTSKEGATKALRYIPIPGKFEGNYPFQQGERAWALG